MSVNFSERLLVGATQTLVITSTRVNEAPLLGTLMTYLFSQRANERWSGDGDQSLFFFFFFWVESLRGRGKWECGTKRGRAPTSNLFTQASRKSPTRPRGEEKKQTKTNKVHNNSATFIVGLDHSRCWLLRDFTICRNQVQHLETKPQECRQLYFSISSYSSQSEYAESITIRKY